MKLLSRYILVMAFLSAMLAVDSCKEPSAGQEQETPVLNVTSGTSVNVDSKACTVLLSFKSTDPWTASGGAGWMTVSPAGGAGGSCSVEVSISANTGDSSRSGKVTINSGKLSTSVTITQSAPAPRISFASKAFESYLVAHYDSDGDGAISEDEAVSIGEIHINTAGIQSIGEISYMRNLQCLEASGNIETKASGKSRGALTALDISANRRLSRLDCSFNLIADLDVSANRSLEYLDASDNKLTSIDVSSNPALAVLDVRNNDIAELDLSENPNIREVNCTGNSHLGTVYVAQNAPVAVTADSGVEIKIKGEYPDVPGDDPSDPGEDPDVPGDDPSDPGEDPVVPGDNPSDPGEDLVEPGDDPSDPGEDHPAPVIVDLWDIAFKEYCVRNFDKDGDGEISIDEAEAVTEISFTSTSSYLYLYGLDSFKNLKTLILTTAKKESEEVWNYGIGYGELISRLVNLTHLECTNIAMYDLDISNMTELEYLDVHGCTISTLDVSCNSKLNYLDCSPMPYDYLRALIVSKDQSIPNVTVNRSADYVPVNTVIYVAGSTTVGGNEGTIEGGEI